LDDAVGLASAGRTAESVALMNEDVVAGVIDAFDDAIFVIDPASGVVVEANTAACSFLGATRDVVVGQEPAALAALHVGSQSPDLLARVAEILAGGSARFEQRIQRSDGGRQWVEMQIKPARLGGAARVVIVIRDIGARKEAEEQARVVRERFELLVTHLPSSAVMLFDHDLRFVLADGPELARNGNPKANLEGELLHDALDPAFAALVEPNLRAALAGRRFHAELPFGELTYSYTYEPVRDASGAVLYAMVFAQDITPQRRAESDARRSDARVRGLVANAPGIVFAIDASRRFTLSEGLGLAHVGLRASEVVGRLVDDVYAGQPEVLRNVTRALAGESVVADVPVGETTWETRYSPLRANDGTVTEVIGVAFDVTDRLRAETAVRQAQKMEAVGQLAGGVAHDFNNMLAAITSAGQELQLDLQASADHRELCEMILAAADRAATLTRQLLAFSRRGPVGASPLALDAVVRETAMLLGRIVDRRVRITTSLGAPSAMVVAELAHLQSAIINLGVNARDAMPGGGDLTIATDVIALDEAACEALSFPLTPGDHARITVTDTGVGIPKESIARVFEPFFTTKGVGEGTGLGLAAVYGTAVAYGGAIVVESEPGRGATFRLLLPLSTEPPVSTPRDASTPMGRGLVLLVEDEPLVQRAARRLLVSLGYDVVLASDGLDGVERFREHHSTLAAVLCDGMMPRMSGTEAIRLMRGIDPGVPIVLCSGYAPDERSTPGAEGHSAILAKPYQRRELALVLARLTRLRTSA
jgi:PAS domain S-box-containing protein